MKIDKKLQELKLKISDMRFATKRPVDALWSNPNSFLALILGAFCQSSLKGQGFVL